MSSKPTSGFAQKTENASGFCSKPNKIYALSYYSLFCLMCMELPCLLSVSIHSSQSFLYYGDSSCERCRYSSAVQRLKGYSNANWAWKRVVRCSSEVSNHMDPVLTDELKQGLVDGNSDVVPEKEMSISTMLLNFSSAFDPFSALSTPIYQTATFRQPSATECGSYDYTRSGNPTRDALEELLAKLEGANRAFCFTSGMAALSTLTHLLEAGQEIVACDDIYGGSDRILSRVTPKAGLPVKRVDTSCLQEVRGAIGPNTKLVWLESPTNPRQMISDIEEISRIAHQYGALVVVDNSIMSPVLCKPLELGADIVMHSATKFIAGHSDVMAGVLAVKGESLAKDIYFLQNAEGSGLAPFDCWLCLRGIKTMCLRIEKQQANAQKIAEYLASHPQIEQATGAGSVLSFTTGSLAISKYIAENTKLFSIAVSFGSVKSLISLPCFMSHASIPTEVRKARGLNEDLVRLSVGIEDADDLIADLDQAIRNAPKNSQNT
eukprot:c19111_g1_i1 orf=214-1689(+)